MTVYLLPGIGCDHRLFDHFPLEGYKTVALDWPPFPKGCTLASIAQAMVGQIDRNEPHVLVGVSMGGMVAQELAVLTNPVKVVLISSWTGPQEHPPALRFMKKMHWWWVINSFTVWASWPVKRFLGQRDRADDKLLYAMALSETAAKIRIGIGAVMDWKGSPWKGPLGRIHGDKDMVIPLRFPVDYVVKGGEHIMVLSRSKEVAGLLQKAIAP